MTAEPSSPNPVAVQPKLAVRTLLGRADDLRAELALEIILPPGLVPSGAEVAVEAALSGPESVRATTLPVRLPVRFSVRPETSAGVALTGRVVLTEPAYWTAELPMRYRLDGRLLVDGRQLAEFAEPIGLRRLGVRGHSLWLDGHRWVPRGVACGRADADLADRLAAVCGTAVAIIDLPATATADGCQRFWDCLTQADRLGQPLILRLLAGSPVATADGIARLAQHPAVIAVSVPAEAVEVAALWKRAAGTMLLAAELPGDQPPPATLPSVDLLMVRLAATALPAAAWRKPVPLPVVAWQSAAEPTRAGCDRLQAALAGWRLAGDRPPADWDWAGFFIG